MLKRLRLINFRRYPKLECNFDSNLNIIEGENNAGKTTIFMGIEYALFGTVSGFKSQTELAHPDADEIGAELIYQGIDGRTYKLQRMHTVGSRGKAKKRGATGYYTLKEIEEDGETYLLSSDFENNPEEMLQLKIFETFGISKRLFNIAINVKQGEISEILLGKADLDIVLGVSAANIAEKSLRKIALGFEKETSQFNNLKNSKDTITQEKDHLTKQKMDLDRQINSVREVLLEYQGQKENFDVLVNAIGNFQEIFNSTFDFGEEWQSSVANYRSLYNSHKQLLEIPVDQLNQKKSELENQDSKLQDDINQFYEKDDDINMQLQQFNQQLGDIEGKLNRRRKVEGSATCEVCGSPIDTKQVKLDIEKWENDQTQIQAQLTVLNAQRSKNKTDLQQARTLSSNLSSEIHKINLKLEQIQKSESQLNEFGPKISENEKSFLINYDKLIQAKEAYENEISKWLGSYAGESNLSQNLLFGTWELSEEKTVSYHNLEVKGTTISKYLELNEFNDRLEIINESKISLSASVDAKISGEKSRLRDIEGMAKDIDPRIRKMEREITTLEGEINKLRKKLKAAGELKNLSKGFKSLSTILRNKSATELANKTWDYHKKLSGSDEYLSLSIDPKNYALLIRPKDIDEEVSAYYYQGGGHKLLLGLAYKFAISNLVTKPTYYLLDEPTYGLDNENKEKLLENIQNLANAVQINLITHQREEISIKGQVLRVEKEDRHSKLEVVS